MKTYVFDGEKWERACGCSLPLGFYMMHLFDDVGYVGSFKYDGSFTTEMSDLTLYDLEREQRYWACYA